jgi:hypothetical protein
MKRTSPYGSDGLGPATPAPLGDTVAGGGQRALLRTARTQQPDQCVEPVGRRQGPGGEILRDRGHRPAGLDGQFPIDQFAVPAGGPAA